MMSVVACPLRYLRSLLFKNILRPLSSANGWGCFGRLIADFVLDLNAFIWTSVTHWIIGTTDRVFKFVYRSPRNPMGDFPAAEGLPFSHDDCLAT